MKKVTGLGGIFFKSENPEALKAWYKQHLGIDADQWGAQLFWKHNHKADEQYSVWSPFKATTTYFAPSEKSYMINFIVDDLHALLAQLRLAGVYVFAETEDTEFGKFGWILDPEHTKIELWEPPK